MGILGHTRSLQGRSGLQVAVKVLSGGSLSRSGWSSQSPHAPTSAAFAESPLERKSPRHFQPLFKSSIDAIIYSLCRLARRWTPCAGRAPNWRPSSGRWRRPRRGTGKRGGRHEREENRPAPQPGRAGVQIRPQNRCAARGDHAAVAALGRRAAGPTAHPKLLPPLSTQRCPWPDDLRPRPARRTKQEGVAGLACANRAVPPGQKETRRIQLGGQLVPGPLARVGGHLR